MKKLVILTLCFYIVSCGSPKDEKIDIEPPIVKSTSQSPVKQTLVNLPIMGSFNIDEMTIDSTNKYGAGDCWGSIRRYSLPNVGLCTDSMICGEYGYTYTSYLLSPINFIQVVHTMESETVLDSIPSYILTERIVDFNSHPATFMERIDTVLNNRIVAITKDFKSDTLGHTNQL